MYIIVNRANIAALPGCRETEPLSNPRLVGEINDSSISREVYLLQVLLQLEYCGLTAGLEVILLAAIREDARHM